LRLNAFDWDKSGRVIGGICSNGTEALVEAGIPKADIAFIFGADLCYFGQQSELRITLPFDPCVMHNAATMCDIFKMEYISQCGLKLDNMPIKLVSWHIMAHSDTPSRSADAIKPTGNKPEACTHTIYLKGKPTEVAVHHHTELAYGEIIQGPVIVEERKTTSFVLPGWTIKLHENGSLIANKQKGA
jgi:N-methylhydantoinase A